MFAALGPQPKVTNLHESIRKVAKVTCSFAKAQLRRMLRYCFAESLSLSTHTHTVVELTLTMLAGV